jgi:uncharacterized protein YkwD
MAAITWTSALRGVGRAVRVALVTVAVVVAVGAGAQPAAADDTATFVARTNELRASVGLPPLSVDAQLSAMAQQWAAHMATTGALVHPSNEFLMGGVTSPFRTIADNVSSGLTADQAWNDLVHSPGHYTNMTLPTITHVGVGIASANGIVYVHQIFMEAGPPPVQVIELPPPVVIESDPPPAPAPLPTTSLEPAPDVEPESPVEVLPTVVLRPVNVAVIPPIEYGRPAPLPIDESSSGLPVVLGGVAITGLVATATILAVRSLRRRVA